MAIEAGNFYVLDTKKLEETAKWTRDWGMGKNAIVYVTEVQPEGDYVIIWYSNKDTGVIPANCLQEFVKPALGE